MSPPMQSTSFGSINDLPPEIPPAPHVALAGLAGTGRSQMPVEQAQPIVEASAQPRHPTWRIRGVPAGIDEEELEKVLRQHPTLQPLPADSVDDGYDGSRIGNGVQVHTLTHDLRHGQVATVRFQHLPHRLHTLAPGGQLTIDVDLSMENTLVGSKRKRGSSTIRFAIDGHFRGITVLSSPSTDNYTVDVLAVHGLGGHPYGSFVDKGDGHMWLSESLPRDMPTARVMIYGYESGLQDSTSFAGLDDLAGSLRAALCHLLGSGEQRRLILIGHSLGCLLIKEALLGLGLSNSELDQGRRIVGALFFGVPNDGMDISSLIPMVNDQPNRALLESLSAINSQVLRLQSRSFAQFLDQTALNLFCFYETKLSPTAVQDSAGRWKMNGPHRCLVAYSSATSCLPPSIRSSHSVELPRTHSELVKFASHDPEYERVIDVLCRMDTARDQVLSETAQDCLKSLAFPQMQNRSHGIGSAVEGTCEWLLQHKTYRSWAVCDQGLLWIKGKPGSGKSTLLKYALDKQATRDGALVLSFFFHGRGDEPQRTPLGLWRSLLHQVLWQAPGASQDLVDEFETKRKQNGKPNKDWHWHAEELMPFFKSSLSKVLINRPVRLFIDALDECGKENAVRLVEIFKSLLKHLPSQSMGCRICFSCRHYPILDLDESMFEICTEDENQQDISKFVDEQLAGFRARTSSTIPAWITERASGVFMWTRLVVKQVQDLERAGAEPAEIEAEIHSIPPDLDKLYQQLIEDMEPASQKLIQWICFATRPLSIDELRWAMFIEADCPYRSLEACHRAKYYVADNTRMKRRVQTLSRGLAEVSHAQVVQFVHQSVKDFFVEKGLSALDGNVTSTEAAIRAHFQFSKICIRYLAMEEICWSTSYGDFTFLHYATTSWVVHAKQCDARSVPQEDLLTLFAWPSNHLVELWVRIYPVIDRYSDECPPEGTSLLHVISRYGVFGLVTAALQSTDQITTVIDIMDDNGRTPLSCAAENGYEGVVRILLDAGAISDLKDENGGTPLLWAAKNGYEGVVRILLDAGATVDSKDKSYGRTPLSCAAENGYEGVVRILLDAGAISDLKDENGGTPLSWAAWNSYEAVVRILLNAGATVDLKDKNSRTPLSLAAENGYEAVVRILLDAGATVDSRDKSYSQTPLLWAVENGHKAVVRILLNAGATVDLNDNFCQKLLLWAARGGYEAIVRILQCHAHASGTSAISTCPTMPHYDSTEQARE